MSFSQIELDIRNRWNVQGFSAPTDYGDPAFSKPDGTWYRLNVLHSPELRAEIGRAAYEASGQIIIQIFTKPDLDNKARADLIDSAAAVYRGVTFSGIYADEPAPLDLGVVNGWRQVNVSIPFEKFTQY